jgi:hypothetical protein
MLTIDRLRILVLAVWLLVLLVPASARADASCPSEPVVRAFLPWADPAWYVMAPDGGMEARAGSWRLSGGAGFVTGNEPFNVGGAGDAWSLAIPDGAQAATAPACIALLHPTLRLFARSPDGPGSALRVVLDFVDLTGAQRSQQIATLLGPSPWAPTLPIPILVNALSPLSAQDVSFRFQAAAGDWQIDDVYVDPYGKG